ncbi:heme-binding protein [Ectothiorhodospiraceae bacterium 2226]|nr:heme-binding protein [Ectothiorhodospiraceae bacterium 2226]
MLKLTAPFALVLLVLSFAVGAVQQQERGTFNYPVLIPELALKAAQAALEACREQEAQVAVAVVDRGGNVQVLLRDRFAGAHTPDTAIGKAWTAVSFRRNTTDMLDMTRPGEAGAGIRDLPGVVVLGGGLVIEEAGRILGGIGISGGPSGEVDDTCGKAGIEAIREELVP